MNTIKNFYKISEELTCSGQPSHEQLAILAEENYEVIINLGLYNTDYSLPDEIGLVELLRMEYYHIPVFFDRPEKENLFDFFDKMDSNPSRKIHVYCAANYRASSFLGLYLLYKERLTENEVEDFIYNIWQPNPVWQAFINAIVDEIKNK